MQLNEKYNRENFLHFLEQSFLPSFKRDVRPINTNGLSNIHKAYSLGRDEKLDLQIFEFHSEGALNNRIALTKEAFNLMKSSATFNGLAIFYSETRADWRLSLMTANPERTEKGKVAMAYSNPRRYSYFLGPNSKVNTPTKFLLNKEKITDFKGLKGRFSIEVVNKEFYKQISESFTKLVGGTVTKGKTKIKHDALLKMPFIQDQSQKCLEFAVRLIGRIIFCWFLREKISKNGKSLMPKELLSLEAVKENEDYYHKILEPIFFEVLNKPTRSRKDRYIEEPFVSIPYLNGGLFSPQYDDHFSYNGDQAINHNILIVPDKWFEEFFEILETYNFTIDENISFDEELSIDPEMLGRIFENLLAEINPETGESARKSTGSYYTPRPIVDYMVDESLALYLQTKTNIEEEKIKAVVSYNLDDDLLNPLNEEERIKIIDALEEVKILDPACGSGAFPIGALQKIVFILQQLDPEGQMWFQKQVKNTAPEIKRVIEREFKNKNFDYIRKLGIIRENIYGVDIQPIATEISRLRCFLTLIVDESVHDELENRGIEPLPNLDFKFVTANSLIGLPEANEEGQMGLFEDDEGIRELKNLRDMFFTASGPEREQLKLRFVQTQNKMFQKLIRDGIAGHADLTTKLTTWDPFSHEPSSWFDSEWMFGIKDGFDIVIANPPYGANIDKLIPQFRAIYPKVIKNYADIFKIFFAFGLNMLRTMGILTYISPNTFLAQPRYKDLREYLLNYGIRKIINLGQDVFDGATVPTAISVITKSTSDWYMYEDASENSKYKRDLQNTKKLTVTIKQINEMPDKSLLQSYTLSDDEVVLDRIMEIKDAGIQYHRSGIGLKNKGGNDLYERLFTNSPNYFKHTIPVWYGQLLNSYFIKSITDEYFNLDYKDILKENESVSFTEEAFGIKRKILWRQTAPYIIATLDEECRWFRNTIQCGWLRGEYESKVMIEYVLALLNSDYIRHLYQKIVNESAGRAFPQVKLTHVKKIPIKIADHKRQLEITEIVRKIFSITKKNNNYSITAEDQEDLKKYKSKIDDIVFEIYNKQR